MVLFQGSSGKSPAGRLELPDGTFDEIEVRLLDRVRGPEVLEDLRVICGDLVVLVPSWTVPAPA